MVYEHRFVEVAGKRTHYLEAGQGGPDVVLLHGGEFGSQAEFSWRHTIDAVAEAGFHVVAPDMLGYGRTAKTFDFENPQGFRMEHVKQTLDVLGIGPAHFAANSAGGHMLLKTMVGRIDVEFDLLSATLISPAPPAIDGLEILRNYDGTPEHMRRILQVLFHDEKWYSDDMVAERQASAMIPGVFECTAAAKLHAPGAERTLERDDVDYGVIEVPVLAVAGSEDVLIFEDLPEQLAAQAPLGRLVTIEGAKHCAQIEQAEKFNALFVDFLESISAPA